MRFSYYPDTDSLYVELVPQERRENKGGGRQVVVSEEMVIDLDSEGHPVGIDLYQYASKIADLSRIEADGPIFGLDRAEDHEKRAG